MNASVSNVASIQLLVPRTKIQISPDPPRFVPTLPMVTAATSKLFLAVEIVSRDDHRADTVSSRRKFTRKSAYLRLWMVDPAL